MNSGPIRVLTADDHPLIREGLAGLVTEHDDIIIVGEAADGEEAIRLFDELKPDVLLLDLQMPKIDGIDAMIAIRSKYPSARIVVLTTYETEQLAARALAAGAKGYLLKSSVRRELINTIRNVHAGRSYVDPTIASTIADGAYADPLSKREIAVLSLIAQGLSNKDIGQNLSITEDTVKTHVKAILLKLQATGRAHAVAIGAKKGIISL